MRRHAAAEVRWTGTTRARLVATARAVAFVRVQWSAEPDGEVPSHSRSSCFASSLLPMSRRAAAQTCSGVKPKFFISIGAGADAPNLSMPIMLPSSPANRSQPKVLAASTVTLFLIDPGRTFSLYSELCSRKISQLGTLTTRVRILSAIKRLLACTQMWTSEPEPRRMTSGTPPSGSVRT